MVVEEPGWSFHPQQLFRENQTVTVAPQDTREEEGFHLKSVAGIPGLKSETWAPIGVTDAVVISL